MPPTRVTDLDLKGITVFLASTATPERGGLPYLDAVLPAEDRLAATRVVRDLGALPPDAILYLCKFSLSMCHGLAGVLVENVPSAS